MTAGSNSLHQTDVISDLLIAARTDNGIWHGQRACQNLIKNNAERVDVRPRIQLLHTMHRLLRTHVRIRGAGSIPHSCLEERIAQFTVRRVQRLGYAEVDDLRHRSSVLFMHQNVRRLQVAMKDAFLMCMMNRLADGDHEVQPFGTGELPGLAERGERQTRDQFHHKPGTVIRQCSGVQNRSDVRVVHSRQRLTLQFKPGDNFCTTVQAVLDQFHRNGAPDWLRLLGTPDDAEPPLAQLLHQPVGTHLLMPVVQETFAQTNIQKGTPVGEPGVAADACRRWLHGNLFGSFPRA